MGSELDSGRAHPRVRSGRVRSQKIGQCPTLYGLNACPAVDATDQHSLDFEITPSERSAGEYKENTNLFQPVHQKPITSTNIVLGLRIVPLWL